MRRVLVSSAILVVSILIFDSSLFAHHGTGVAYQEDKLVTLKGTVTEWIWSNPHCGILFDVTDEQGSVAHWAAELGNPHQLSAGGFGKDVLKPGDKISVTGHPSRSGAPRIQFLHMQLPDGRTLTMEGVKGNGEKADTNY